MDSTHAELSNKDRDNEAKSANYGWVISVFFMLLFLFMNYKLVYLRVRSGIRINVQFTELDAEGGFFEKLMRVIASILQRQGQRFLVFIHKLGSTGTATLQNFDGRVILTAGNYNGAKQDPSVVAAAPPDISNDDINGSGNPSVPPTPPNSGGNGGNGGNGGGNDDGNTPRTPRSPQKRKKVGTVAFSSLTYERQRELAASFHEGGYIYVFLEWLDALLTTNPEVTVFDDEQLALFDRDLEHACDLASAFANKRLNPTPEAVETPPTPSVVELVLNEFEPVVTTPKTVVTTPKTVVTVEKTVTTVLEAQNNEFTYGDELLKGFKQAFGAELNNIKVGNGKKESIMPRLIVKSAAFDKAVREVKATPKLRTEICEWVGDNVQPLISEFLTGAKEGEKK